MARPDSKLPADARIRVFGGDPGPGDNRSRETAAVSVLKEQVLQKRGKVLVIYSAAHFYRTMSADYLSSMGEDIGIVRVLEMDYPGRAFAVIPVGGRLDLPPGVTVGIDPDYQKFDRALRTQVRPVLVSFERSPFPGFHSGGVPWPHVADLPWPRWLRQRVQGQHSDSRPNG